MRTKPTMFLAMSLFFLIAFCAGCTSMAERGLLPDVTARRPPDVYLGEKILLLKEIKVAEDLHFASLIGTDGRAHLFVADRKEQIHHVAVSENGMLQHELLGTIEGTTANRALDAVEHPAGRLRVLAGNKQFIRQASEGKWEEFKGNPCSKFIVTGDELLCAYIANGKDVGAPMRRDWTVGWCILFPIAFWSDVIADKLVLAQESNNGWNIVAVFDPKTKLSALSDFMVETDRDGSLHFLYRMSVGGRAFILAFGAGGGGAWGTGPNAEIRYARVPHDKLLSIIKDSAQQGDHSPIPWESIHGLPLVPLPPYIEKGPRTSIGPLDRRFGMNSISGDLGGLVRLYETCADDGIHKTGGEDNPWINVKIKEGTWDPHFEILTARDLPELGWEWIDDLGAFMKSDSNGISHVLLVKSKFGFWTGQDEMCYFRKTGSDWSAPLIMGGNLTIDCHRSLAVDANGKVFAVWESRDNQLIGRWIIPKK